MVSKSISKLDFDERNTHISASRMTQELPMLTQKPEPSGF